MGAERDARLGALEQLGASHSRFGQTLAQRLGERDGVCRRLEHQRLRVALELRQRPGHARRERPGARVVRLVAVEPHRTELEVEIAPAERQRLRHPATLADEESPQQPLAHGNGRASHQRAILAGVHVRKRALATGARQEALRDRVRLDQLQRIHRQREHAVEDERHVPARVCSEWRPPPLPLRAQRLHDQLAIGELQIAHADRLDHRIHMLL
ncbi:MAG: hypothetical protein QM756_24105 [Polyangiaceae bacterium]